jgi:hypothetical protein
LISQSRGLGDVYKRQHLIVIFVFQIKPIGSRMAV